MKLGLDTIALLALGTAATYYESRGDQKRADSARAAADAIRAGIAVDNHMRQIADMMLSQEDITDEQWDEQTARIQANTDAFLAGSEHET